jgi:hypothetical protein
MANSNNISGVISTQNPQLIGNGMVIPAGFNDINKSGKLESLFLANSDAIYNKYDPKTGYTNGLLKFGPRQPFITTKINDANKGINGTKKYESQAFPLGSAVQDLERIAKWSVTGNGVIFLGKQLLLQGFQTFNETKLYNPLTPVLAAARNVSFGLIPRFPRHIDVNGLIGSFTGLPPKAPYGTVGDNAIPSTANDGQKGLLRAVTTNTAYVKLIERNNITSRGGTSLLGAIKGYFIAQLSGLGQGLLPQRSTIKATYRVDEGAYGINLSSRGKYNYFASDGSEIKWGENYGQIWEAGTNQGNAKENIKKEGQSSLPDSKKTIKAFGKDIPLKSTLFGKEIGYDLERNNRGYIKYGENVGMFAVKKRNESGTYKYSNILSIYKVFTDDSTKLDSKFTDEQSDQVKSIQDNLNKVIAGIKRAGYEVDSSYVPYQQFSDTTFFLGMDSIKYKTNKLGHQAEGLDSIDGYGYISKFKRKTKTLDYNSNEKWTFGFATTNASDRINLLSVLGEGDSKYPYTGEDDLINFSFYDIVNKKYIPFRATVKGISENSSAEWNDIQYIGRADKLYSYKGFSRNLSFTFMININSIKELLPTWTRINYLMGLVKPSNYTNGNDQASNMYSKFIIPPLIQLTIGDLYKNQPAIIKTIGMSVLDDASWETLNEETSEKNDWDYLNKNITWKDSKGKYAQLPRTVEISISVDLLEKERPITGGANYGDAYRDQELKEFIDSPKTFSKNIVIKNNDIIGTGTILPASNNEGTLA